MDRILGILGACNVVKKAEQNADEDASDVQLNAFEFRNYRTSLDDPQQKLLERIVNQQSASLVKGKTLKVNSFEEKVYLDKDLLVLEYNCEYYPLRSITKMDFFKDTDDMMGAPWVIDITFWGRDVERNLIFNFEQERGRLNFAITLRILRTRDPELDVNQPMEVVFQEDEEAEPEVEHKTFNRIVSTQHYNIQDAGIPIIFSVSDLKLYQRLQSTSRHVYLEFFVKYPNQDKYLYAKSPTTHIPPQVHQQDDAHYKKKVKKDEEEEKKEGATDKDGKPEALCAMRFDLKNVKLKIPKVPHQIFGRLMAKDDYFPTAVGTFDFKVDKTFLQDRRTLDAEEKAKERGGKDDSKKEPEAIGIPMFSAMKVPQKPSADKTAKKEDDKIIQIGQLNIRILGYVNDTEKMVKAKERKKSKKDGSEDEEESDEEHSQEEEEEDSEEDA